MFKLQGAKTAWDFPEICDFTVTSGIGDVHFLTHEVASSLGQSPPWSCHRSQAKACIAKATVKSNQYVLSTADSAEWSCAMLRMGQIERTRSPSMPLMLNTLNLLQKCVWIYINSNGKLHKPKCTAMETKGNKRYCKVMFVIFWAQQWDPATSTKFPFPLLYKTPIVPEVSQYQ